MQFAPKIIPFIPMSDIINGFFIIYSYQLNEVRGIYYKIWRSRVMPWDFGF